MEVRELTLRAATPIVINVFNQLHYLRRMVDWLTAEKFRCIVILDNASSFPPLLDYLDRLGRSERAIVLYYGVNRGPHYFFLGGLYRQLFDDAPFLYSDPDLDVPDLSPRFLSRLFDLSRRYGVYKVGCALTLPTTSTLKSGMALRHRDSRSTSIIDWERQYWSCPIETDVYDAPIDTTLHLFNPAHYRKGDALITGLRVAGSGFEARHLPWFKDDPCPADELRYYQQLTSHSTWQPTAAATPG